MKTIFQIILFFLHVLSEPILHRVWYALVGHIKKVLESGIKSDVKEMFTFFLTQFQTLVLSQTISVTKILVSRVEMLVLSIH